MEGIVNHTGKERATPFKLSLCVLLHLYISPKCDLQIVQQNGESQWPLGLSQVQVRGLQLFLVKSIKMIDDIQEPALSVTLGNLRHELGNNVAQRLRHVLMCIKSPDDLFDLLESMKLLLVPPSAANTAHDVDASGRPSHIEWSGVFGMFLRRVFLTSKLSFEAISRLFHDIQQYTREPSTATHLLNGRQLTTPVQSSQDDDRREKKGDASQSEVFRSFVSRRQLQQFLHRMAERIESMIGVSTPEQTEAEIAEMLKVAPDLPRAHLLRYLNYLHHREYQGAVDSLHTYFDFCIRQGGPTPSGVNRPMTQYAVLNLAALHFQFGYEREAMHAIQETVRVAQQNGDHTCLAFTLSWMFRLSAAQRGEQTASLVRKCLQRSEKLGLQNVQGLTQLVTAQHLLLAPPVQATALPPVPYSFTSYSAAAPKAYTVWQAIDEGVHSSLQGIGVPSAEAEISLGRQSGRYSTGDIADSDIARHARGVSMGLDFESLMSIAGRSELLRHSSWGLYGNHALSKTALQRHYLYLRGHGPGSDTCLALAHVAACQVATGQLSDLSPRAVRCEKPSMSLFLGHLFPGAGFPSSSVSHRRAVVDPSADTLFGPALRLLVHAQQTMYPHAVGNVLLQGICTSLHQFMLAVGNVSMANQIESAFRALSPSSQRVGGIGGNVAGEASHAKGLMMWVNTLVKTGRLTEAVCAVQHAAAFCAKKQLYAHQVQLDLSFAEIYLKACGSVPAPALPHSLRCLTLSSQLEHDAVYTDASLVLAKIHLQFGYFHRSLALLQRALPHVLSNGTVETKAETHLLLAKCYLALGGSRTPLNDVLSADTARQQALLMLLSRVENALENALVFAEHACQLGLVVEILYLLSLVANAIYRCVHTRSPDSTSVASYLKKRNRYATRFQQIRQSRTAPVDTSIGLLESGKLLGRLCSLTA